MAMRMIPSRLALLAGIAAAALIVAPAEATVERARAAQARGDLRAAQIELRNAARSQPNAPDVRAALAAASIDLGDYDTAEKEARAALERGYDRVAGTALLMRALLGLRQYEEILRDFPVPSEPPALAAQIAAARAHALVALRRPDDALSAAELAVRLAPDAPGPHLARAAVALATRDRAGAEAAVAAALAADPRNIEALLLTAEFRYAARDYEGAAAALARVVEVQPGHAAARVMRAEALMRLERVDQARQEVDAALRLAPNLPNALFLRATLLARADDWRGADEALQRIGPALAQLPDGLLLTAVVKRALGQTAQATDAARRHVARAPNDPRGARLLAAIELSAGRPGEAAVVLRAIAARGAADAETLDMLSRVEAQLGQPAAAAEAQARAVELAPSNAELLSRLAAARIAVGDIAGASDVAQQALRATPDSSGGRAMLAVAALLSGDVASAQTEYDRMSADGRSSTGGRLLDGVLRLARADLSGARGLFEGILTENPRFQPAQLGLARVALAEGKPDEAVRLYSAVLDAEPGHADAGRILAAIAASRGSQSEAARQALIRAQAAAPDNLVLAGMLAQVLIAGGDPRSAASLLDTPALQVRGRGPQGAMMLAEARTAAGDLTGAETASRTALAEDPRNAVARRQLAIILVRRGDAGAAETLLREGRTTQPGDPVLQGALVAIVQHARGLDAAIALADEIDQQPEARPASTVLRGDLFASVGRKEEAAEAYAAAYAEVPSAMLALRRAAMLQALGRPQAAAGALAEWVARDPDDKQAQSQLAQYEIQAGKLDEAERRLEAIVLRTPGDAVVLNNLAWLLEARGADSRRSQAFAERAYFLNPSPATADTLGWILVRHGQAERGVALLRQAVEAGQGRGAADPAIVYRLAFGLKTLGRAQEAQALLGPVLAGDARFAERADAERLMTDLRGSN